MIQIDMTMPDNCVECRFNVSEFGYCNAMPVNFCGYVNDFEEDGRPEWCPLQAQEPRVMALEDVLKLRFNDVVYFEMAISSVVIPAIVIDVIEHMPDGEIGLLQLRHIQQPTNNADLEYYGKTWRVWDRMPTDEQREKEPWDDAER